MGFKIEKTEDHVMDVLEALEQAKIRALTIIGENLETFAKALCPVGTSESTGIKGYRGGTLRNSITYELRDDEVWVGTNVEYAPYVELGTGPHFVPPPDWEQFTAATTHGIKASYVHPRPFLRPAVEDHLDYFKDIMEKEFKY